MTDTATRPPANGAAPSNLPAVRNGAPASPGQMIEQVVIQGDLSKLTSNQRANYYARVCESLGLNPYTRPFDYLSLSGKMVLYARKDATDQLRSLRKVSITSITRETIEGVHIVTVRAQTPDGRVDEEVGAVTIKGLQGEALANALMKATTKAKRRATLAIVGLGWLDESDVESIKDAHTVTVDADGVIQDRPALAGPNGDRLVLIEEARALYDQLQAAGIAAEKPADTQIDTLRAWMQDWHPRLAEQDQRPVEAPEQPAPTSDADPDDDLPFTAPKWASGPHARAVSEVTDQAIAAGLRVSPPPDDATDADVEGWLASKRSAIKQRTK